MVLNHRNSAPLTHQIARSRSTKLTTMPHLTTFSWMAISLVASRSPVTAWSWTVQQRPLVTATATPLRTGALAPLPGARILFSPPKQHQPYPIAESTVSLMLNQHPWIQFSERANGKVQRFGRFVSSLRDRKLRRPVVVVADDAAAASAASHNNFKRRFQRWSALVFLAIAAVALFTPFCSAAAASLDAVAIVVDPAASALSSLGSTATPSHGMALLSSLPLQQALLLPSPSAAAVAAATTRTTTSNPLVIRSITSPLSVVAEAQLCLRLLYAAAVGGAIGKERAATHRAAAGVRTMALVALGAAAFTLCSMYGFGSVGGVAKCDPSRMASSVASGVGFIGAGVITTTNSNRHASSSNTGLEGDVDAYKNSNSSTSSIVHGLTTASAIWLSAAVGVLCGVGMFLTSTMTGMLTLVVLRYGRNFLQLKGNNSRNSNKTQQRQPQQLQLQLQQQIQAQAKRLRQLEELQREYLSATNTGNSMEGNQSMAVNIPSSSSLLDLSAFDPQRPNISFSQQLQHSEGDWSDMTTWSNKSLSTHSDAVQLRQECGGTNDKGPAKYIHIEDIASDTIAKIRRARQRLAEESATAPDDHDDDDPDDYEDYDDDSHDPANQVETIMETVSLLSSSRGGGGFERGWNNETDNLAP